MNAADLKQIRQAVKEEVTGIVQTEVSRVVKEEVTGIVQTEVSRVVKEEVTKIVTASEEKIISEVANFISKDVLPQFDDKADKSDIERLERKIDRALDMGVDHESRIKDIERIPVIAHELKSGKSR